MYCARLVLTNTPVARKIAREKYGRSYEELDTREKQSVAGYIGALKRKGELGSEVGTRVANCSPVLCVGTWIAGPNLWLICVRQQCKTRISRPCSLGCEVQARDAAERCCITHGYK